ncbi:MAG: type II toxin-antitoxin system Phd/YefM family antitoxin [Chromatiales bacterium]|jgi:prevent-host-death family protein|nr:type II toxin-antitoxin system Phd/YefM family antitoxin [Chromatiales bacterium]
MSKLQHRGSEDARRELPALIADAEGGTTTIISRHGKPVAALVPLSAWEARGRQQSLLPLEGSGRRMWGRDSRVTLRKLRDEWSR